MLFLDQWSRGILEIWGIFFVCVLVDSEYLFKYLCKVLLLVPYVSYDIILFYFGICDLHDLWIHIRIVKGVFRNTSRGFEVLQT